MLENGAEVLYYCDDRALQSRCPKTPMHHRMITTLIYRTPHIKTHLWDLSTNLSKLNILLKLKNIVYMKVKYITTINKHFFDVSLPLDDEMKLKAWHYQH